MRLRRTRSEVALAVVRLKTAVSLGFLLLRQGDAQRRMRPGYTFPLEGEALAEYIRLNVLAATDELHELLAEVGWKPWKSAGYGKIANRQRYIDELADVILFVLNLGVAAGVSGHELYSAIEKKWRVNEARQQKGY